MTAVPRVVSCGEALIDLIGTDQSGRRWHAAPGGSPFNAAIAASRLGAPTGFLGVLSTDRFGTLLTERLDGSNVRHVNCQTTDEPTTLAIVSQRFGDDEPSFAFHVAGTTTVSSRVNDLHLPPDVGVFHTSGSMSLVIEPAASRIEALLAAAQRRALIHLDPNPRPALAGGRDRFLRKLRRWLTLADVVKVSVADLAWLYPGADPMAIARGWVTGESVEDEVPAAVVVTRGLAGAAVVRVSSVIEVSGSEVDVVDTVGAGDTFVGAMLAAFAAHRVSDRAALERLDDVWWRTALTYAVEAAGIACTRVGADPPWRNEL